MSVDQLFVVTFTLTTNEQNHSGHLSESFFAPFPLFRIELKTALIQINEFEHRLHRAGRKTDFRKTFV